MKEMKKWEDCTKAQKIERWEHVLEVLRGLSKHERREHWNMNLWAEKTECGTVACAAGHCALNPWFRRRGFQINFYRFKDPSEDNPDGLWDYRWRDGNYEEDIVVDFFGWRGTDEIFTNVTPRSVGTVIKEVKAFIKLLKAMPADRMNWRTSNDGWMSDYEDKPDQIAV